MSESPLGKHSDYPERYAPELLHGIPRLEGRRELGLGDELPFFGGDVWNAYELSWLDERGKPVVAVGEFGVVADSPNIIESKSLKLYLGSLNGMRYAHWDEVEQMIRMDLREACGGKGVGAALKSIEEAESRELIKPPGVCIDGLKLEIDAYEPDANFLRVAEDDSEVEETLHSNLLRSLCPVTAQPDWGTVVIRYKGPRIDREGLLRYVVSFRDHQGFHEHCVERMWVDVMGRCQPSELMLQAHYLRRGGLDINPFRTNCQTLVTNPKLLRQ